MAIITLAETKTILRISDSSEDTFISAMIPMIQDFVITYCNNSFEFKKDDIYLETSGISFVSSTRKIVDEADGFIEAGFVNGMEVKVFGSLYNDGIYLVDTVLAASLELDSAESLTDEDEGLTVLITWVKFPEGIKPAVAKLIRYEIQNSITDKASAERVGNESYTYDKNRGTGIYPKELLNNFRTWKRPVKI